MFPVLNLTYFNTFIWENNRKKIRLIYNFIMKKKREYDNKVLIDKENFINLLAALKIKAWDNKIITNHYYDTVDHSIFKKAGVLRIQERSNEFIAKFKKGIDKTKFDEFSCKVDDEILNDWKSSKFAISKFQKMFEKYEIDYKKIIYLGKVVTHRYEIKFKTNKILIDHSVYNSNEDYEIECKSLATKNVESKETEEQLLLFCQKYKISTLNTKMSKYARFLNTLKD